MANFLPGNSISYNNKTPRCKIICHMFIFSHNYMEFLQHYITGIIQHFISASCMWPVLWNTVPENAVLRNAVNPNQTGGFQTPSKTGGGELHPPCFSGTIRPIILKFGMLMARTILMDFPLVPEQNIRNFRKNSGITIFPEFSGKSGIF